MKFKHIFTVQSLILLISCQYSTETYKEGKIIYDIQCAACHGLNGEGLGTLYPNLYDTEYLLKNRENIVCWIYKGIGPDSNNARNTRFTDQAMPPINILDAVEICNILNYLNGRFWKAEAFTIQEIKNNLESCKATKNEMQQLLMVK